MIPKTHPRYKSLLLRDKVKNAFKEGYLAEEDSRINTLIPGFIAEEVAEVYPIACEYDDNKPENWNIRFMVPAMLKLIQDQNKEIETLKEQINNKVVS